MALDERLTGHAAFRLNWASPTIRANRLVPQCARLVHLFIGDTSGDVPMIEREERWEKFCEGVPFVSDSLLSGWIDLIETSLY